MPTAPSSFTSTCEGLACSFDGSGSLDPDGTVVSYAWDFGDRSSADGEVTAHTFGTPGGYPVTLTVTDDSGATDTLTRQVVVSAAPPPSTGPDFRAGSSSNAVPGEVRRDQAAGLLQVPRLGGVDDNTKSPG